MQKAIGLAFMVSATPALAQVASVASGSVNPTSSQLNVTSYTPYLDLDATNFMSASSNCPHPASWWSSNGQAPISLVPFSLAKPAVCYGIPGSGANPVVSPGPTSDVWLGWFGEYEAYPDYNLSAWLTATQNRASPVQISNGTIKLLATVATPYEQSIMSPVWSRPANGPERVYYSGAFSSYPQVSNGFGLFSVTMKLALGQGAWPAFWLVPGNPDYTSPSAPAAGTNDTEIDIEGQGTYPGSVWFTVHAPSIKNNSHSFGFTGQFWGADLTNSYHRYAVEITPPSTPGGSHIIFSIDGLEFGQVISTPVELQQPLSYIDNLAMGGWEGAPSTSVLPSAETSIDSIRFFANPNGAFVASLP